MKDWPSKNGVIFDQGPTVFTSADAALFNAVNASKILNEVRCCANFFPADC